MTMHGLRNALLAGCGILAGCAAQETATQGTPSVSPEAAIAEARQQLLQQLAEGGVRVDEKAQTVSIDAAVNPPADPLEYLLIHRRGKGHEALFVTEVKPSLLHSAFLLLGYDKGKNAGIEPIEPPPTEAEVEAGAPMVKVIEPQGREFWISVSWQTEDDTRSELLVDDLIVDLTTGELLEGNAWLYLGGRLAALYRGEPPVFVADYEGNMISICYLMPANHLGTMRHVRAGDDQNFWMTKTCPPPGTPVQLHFHATEPELAKARRGKQAQAKAAADKLPTGR